jgi:GNAT superfamily N-acetyltransferase
MTLRYRITAARPHDLTQLPAIELAASQLFAGMAPESVLNMTTSQDALKQAQRDGRLWVVLADEAPVAFALVEIIERDAVHLEEIDVHPDHGRRGLGTRLVMHVCRWAAAAGFQSVTLNTHRDVPWNAPFYAGLGFKLVPHEDLSPALRAVFDRETRRGLDPSCRVVMRRPATTAWADPMAVVDRSVTRD